MTALIEGTGTPDDVFIHDLAIYQMPATSTPAHTQVISFTDGASSGRISNVRCRANSMLQDEGFRLDGDWIVDGCDVEAADECIIVEDGNVTLLDNTLRGATTGILVITDFSAGVIGSTVYRGITTPFQDADTDVVGTIFTDTSVALWRFPGTLATATGVERIVFRERSFILSVDAVCDTAGTGTGSNTFDVHKNGTTVFTTQANRPTMIATETDSGRAGPDVRDLAAGDYLTVDIDAVTATTPCEDTVVAVRYVEVPAA